MIFLVTMTRWVFVTMCCSMSFYDNMNTSLDILLTFLVMMTGWVFAVTYCNIKKVLCVLVIFLYHLICGFADVYDAPLVVISLDYL